MTAHVASQLRSFSSFDVGACEPRVDGPTGHSLMVVDRFDPLRLAVVAILFVGLSPGVADDFPCLARVNALGDAFMVAVMGLHAHTFSNYSMLSVLEVHAVLCDMVNRDIALWVSKLMRAASRGGCEGVRGMRWRVKAALGASVYPLLRNPSFSRIEVTMGSARVSVC